MMPQLGVLSSLHEKAALDVFHKDCLIYLGTNITPAGPVTKEGKNMMEYNIDFGNGKKESGVLKTGEMKIFPLGVGETAKAALKPHRGFDLGEGPGKLVEETLHGGVVGIILDGRGRPLAIPEEPKERVAKLLTWFKELDVYPIDTLKEEE